MNDKNLIRRCKTLAAHDCANWRDHECLARDCPCDMIHPRFATIHDGALNCDYFLTSVLPLDTELNRLVWCSILGDEERAQSRIRFCTVCGSAYIPTSPRQKYCSLCGAERKRQRSRDKQRRYTERKRTRQQTYMLPFCPWKSKEYQRVAGTVLEEEESESILPVNQL